MSTTFKVPSIMCAGCGDTITKGIKVHDENADVKVNIEQKTVEVDSEMSESSVRQAITATGHEVG
ncbi:heavy-metal-associated domain-containing protein [Leptolyngbya sp. BC1307]|uniref:heavy-metal-associated domain-containing protein n=1 Tax=Leptolyngbya sp. BC1307 TaxID=2029589 RepID=UPI000EFC7CDA|nr:heavy-metal-associated domain-containing protein [Leptolyngbya sp. BC1307]